MFFGHQKKIDLFKKLAKSDKLSHAYLFFGEPQIGKFTFAQNLAYFLEYGEFNTLQKPLVDSLIISSNEKNIKLDDLNEFNHVISQKPLRSSRRLIIIDECQKLTPHAQSSLLKHIEEASNHTTFILVGNDPQTLLPPLASRLMKVYFQKFSNEEIKKILMDEFNTSQQKAKEVADQSFGRLGLAIESLQSKSEKSDDIIHYLRDKIKNLYLQNKIKNSSILSNLLKREEKIMRYNINPRVQKKAINFEIKS